MHSDGESECIPWQSDWPNQPKWSGDDRCHNQITLTSRSEQPEQLRGSPEITYVNTMQPSVYPYAYMETKRIMQRIIGWIYILPSFFQKLFLHICLIFFKDISDLGGHHDTKC